MEFLAWLCLGGSLTILSSFALWPELRFGGPTLVHFMLFLYSRRNLHASCSFIGWLPYTRQYLPFVHVAILYLLGTNWALASYGVALGMLVRAMQVYTPLGRCSLPEPLYKLGAQLGLGHASQEWQVRARAIPGYVLGSE